MSSTEKISEMLKEQQELIASLEREVQNLAETDLLKENTLLKSELEKSQIESVTIGKKFELVRAELERTQRTLQESMLREKMDVLMSVDKRISDYYIKRSNEDENRLFAFECDYLRQIDNLEAQIYEINSTELNGFCEKLEEIKMQFQSKLSELKNESNLKRESLKSENAKKYQELRNEDITKEELENNLHKKSFESFIGLNLLNKIGILLIIIGTITVGRFAYTRLTEEFKSVLIFAFGAILLGLGEYIARKSKNNIIAQGFISGGIAVLYAGVAVSFFWLNLITVIPAFLLIIAVTALAFSLSMIHDSQTVSAFAIAGGYLPLVGYFMNGVENFKNSPNYIYLTVAYFAILCIFSLIISLYKNWKVTQITGFILNVAAVNGVFWICRRLFVDYGVKNLAAVAIGFTFMSFLAYTIIPVFRKRGKLQLDVVSLCIMTANIVFSYSMLFLGFKIYFLFMPKYIIGIIPAVFALIYVPIAYFAGKSSPNQKGVNGVLYIISLVLCMLIVPATFGLDYLPISWVIESAVLTCYGIINKQRFTENSGLIAFAVSLICYFIAIINFNDFPLSFLQYSTVITTFIAVYAILALAARNYFMNRIPYRIHNVFAMINTCIFGILISNSIIYEFTTSNNEFENIYGSLMLTALFFEAVVLITPRFKALRRKSMFIVSFLITIIAFIMVSSANIGYDFRNVFSYSFLMDIYNKPMYILNVIVMIPVSLASIACIYAMFRELVIEFHMKTEAVPIAVLAATILQTSFLLHNQFNLRFDTVWMSMIYLGLAIIWIAFGFIKRYRFTRLTGLGLTFLSLAKLFLFDLSDLKTGSKIISYFVFGGLLIGISFIYQYFNNQIEAKSK